jgi:hypothetical protein
MTLQHRRANVVGARFLGVALALAAAGCATGRPVLESASQEVEVTVENQNFKDAVVYAIWDSGPRARLGMVTGNTTQTFTAAPRGSGEMRVEVDFIAGSDTVTESIGVFRGDEIHVVIPPNA